ncbi:MAG: hypothetical protein WD042_19315 [Phycisphaeraceae bacterium]
MIRGHVSDDGTPYVALPIAGSTWQAVVDTGFNGYLELPLVLQEQLHPTFVGRATSRLAGGQSVEEDVFLVNIPFDDHMIRAAVTFVDSDELLLGTAMLRCHQLRIDFPMRSLELVRTVDHE